MLSLWPERILQAFLDSPAGCALPSPLIARRAGITSLGICGRLDRMAEHGLVATQDRRAKPVHWTLRPVDDPSVAIARMRQQLRRQRGKPRPVAEPTRAMRAQQARVVGRMRALMEAGIPLDIQTAVRLLDEAMDVGRAVIAAKATPGCRFTGAEVDLLVAHELRQISEAAERARDNLRQALDMMLA